MYKTNINVSRKRRDTGWNETFSKKVALSASLKSGELFDASTHAKILLSKVACFKVKLNMDE